MKKFIVIFTFFNLLFAFNASFAQQDSISAWQEQLLMHIDADEFSDAAYARLMEMISDLELTRRDTIFPLKLRQSLILRYDRSKVLRYRLEAGKDWKMGITLHNDPDESFLRRAPWFDAYSGFLSYKNTILGNFRLRLGSGLLLNHQFSLGKSFLSDAFMSSGTRLSPHASTDEYNFMQGAASDLRLGRLRLLPFFSFKQIDAAVSEGIITSIPTDGYHRTVSERAKRHRATVLNTGLHAAWRTSNLELGANLLYSQFSNPYIRPSRAYNIYYFRGKSLLQCSVDYHARFRGFELRGETAFDQNLSLATIAQLSRALGEDWRATLLFRHFGKRYWQLYGSTVSEGSAMQGETGAALSVQGEPLPHWRVNFLFDYFRFSTVQYPKIEPYDGFELRAQALYNRRNFDASLTYRLKSKNSLRHSLDGIFSYNLSDALRLKTQLRGKIFSPKDVGGYQAGFAVGQAVFLNLKKDKRTEHAFFSEPAKFSCELQAAYFDAEDYDARLYLSERNILYGFDIPMLYGRGLRASLAGVYRISPRIILDTKYAVFDYLDGRTSVKSGLKEIQGHVRHQICFQLRFKL